MSKAVEYSDKDQKLFSRTKKKAEGEKKRKKKSSSKKKKVNKEDSNAELSSSLIEEKKDEEINLSNLDEKFFNEDNKENKKGLMLTELLNINNNDNNDKKKDNNKNSFLEEYYQKLNAPLSLRKGVDLGIKKTNDEIFQKIQNNHLKINNKNISFKELFLNKSCDNTNNNSMIFLTRNDKLLYKEKLKRLNALNKNEQYLKNNIFKLEQNERLFENLSFPKENIVDSNIYNYKLKIIRNNKENLLEKLETINKEIENVMTNEKKLLKNDKKKLDFSKLEKYQEEYNNHLSKMIEKERNMRLIYKNKIQLSNDKRQKELDNKEKKLNEEKLKKIKNAKDKEKQLFLKRQKIVNDIMEKSKKYLNEKCNKSENDYRYFIYKEKFENSEKKLINKIKMMKKAHLVTKEELNELLNKIKEQKKILQIDNDEKKKNLYQLWSCRSQTLPTYHHPLLDVIEKEKNIKKEQIIIEEKRKEYNELQKKNYKPPNVTTSQKLKEEREKPLIMTKKEKIKEIELNNKKNIRLKLSSLKPIPKKKLDHQLSCNIIRDNNNYIDIKELNSFKNKKYKKILKPIQILHPRPVKPIDYLSEIKNKRFLEKKENDDTYSSFSLNINKIINNKNMNILESMMTARNNIEVIDNKIRQNKELINSNNGYLYNPKLADKLGKLIVNSVKAKLNILYKLNEK